MKYVVAVAYHGMIKRFGPYAKKTTAQKQMDKIHESWKPFLIEEGLFIPKKLTEQAPQVWQVNYIIKTDNTWNKVVDYVYKILKKERKTKLIWEQAK